MATDEPMIDEATTRVAHITDDAAAHPRRRGFRDGLVAAVVLVAVAAAGGVIGFPGLAAAPSPPPRSPASSHAAIAVPSSSLGPTVHPEVTPAVRCGTAAPGSPPIVTLRIDGAPVRSGRIVGGSLLQGGAEASGPADYLVPSGHQDDLWVEDGRCAVAWTIVLDGERISDEPNLSRDPAVASQNRFALALNTAIDRDASLTAHLVFPEGDATYAWHLQLSRPDVGFAALIPQALEGQAIEMHLGCNVTFDFGARVGGILGTGCAHDVPPGLETLHAVPGTVVEFSTGVVFSPTTGADLPVACGRSGPAEGQGGDFVPDPGCHIGYAVSHDSSFAFALPDKLGIWMVAVHGCHDNGIAKVCGTWYGQIDTIDPIPSGSY